MQDMRASFAEEKTIIYSRYSNPNNEFISKVCMERLQLVFCLPSGMKRVFHYGCFIEILKITLFHPVVFLVQHIHCLLIIFQNGT
jgi:hypothetical protein